MDEEWYAVISIGLVLFFASLGFLIWNEGRAVHREQDLQEGIRAVVPVPSIQTVDTSLNRRLVYVSGELRTNETLVDPIFGISTNALKFHRGVEMFQWKESSSTKTTKLPNGETSTSTSYTYSKVWSSSVISSYNFKTFGHTNPSKHLVDPLSLETSTAMIGAYPVSERILSLADWYTPWSHDINISTTTDASLTSKGITNFEGGLYIGNNSQSPSIGDNRVNFKAVLADTVSIIAMQGEDGRLGAFTTSRGGELLLMRRGIYSSAELFSEAQSDNVTTTQILRCVCSVMIFVGVLLVLIPLVVAYPPWLAGIVVALMTIIIVVIVTITLKKKAAKTAENDVSNESVVEALVVVEDEEQALSNSVEGKEEEIFVPTSYKP